MFHFFVSELLNDIQQCLVLFRATFKLQQFSKLIVIMIGNGFFHGYSACHSGFLPEQRSTSTQNVTSNIPQWEESSGTNSILRNQPLKRRQMILLLVPHVL